MGIGKVDGMNLQMHEQNYFEIMNKKNTLAQAYHVDYSLHTLGWKAFQDLCATITTQIWDREFQSFFDSNDGGRDGAFRVKSEANKNIVVQCKFTGKSSSQIKLSDLKDELLKATRLTKKGLCDEYILFTNHSLTGTNEEKIKSAFEAIDGLDNFRGYAKEAISKLIRENTTLRMLVPRIYGLGDLSEILDERAESQALEILSSLGGDLHKFVKTGAFNEAASALMEENFILLLGEPACGKSTIAATLCVGAIDKWQQRVFKIRNADEFIQHYNPKEPKQLFWIDDAFGATQLDSYSVEGWNSAFPQINSAIRNGARFIFTSRDYIYRSAKRQLKETSLPILRESQVVIKVEELSESEKQQILYNHIKLGNQTKAFKTKIKNKLDLISAQEKFSPEIARRLGLKEFTKKLINSEKGVIQFSNEPMDFLCDSILTLADSHKAAQALIAMRGGRVKAPIKFTENEENQIQKISPDVSSISQSFTELDGSFVRRTIQNQEIFYSFKHPTMWDAFSAVIAEDIELLDIYIVGTKLNKLLQEICCIGHETEGAKITIPKNRYNQLLKRFTYDLEADTEMNRLTKTFLAYRADKIFISSFLKMHPNFLSTLKLSSWYSYRDLNMLCKLKEYNLLPNEDRERHIDSLLDKVKYDLNTDILDDDVKELFIDDEYAEAMTSIKSLFKEKMDKEICDMESCYDSSEDPENHYEEFRFKLEEWRDHFEHDSIVFNVANDGIQTIDNLILNAEYTPPDDENNAFDRSEHQVQENAPRSIFDDVDQ